jgi:hypothetical protein
MESRKFEQGEAKREERMERLAESLELVTARMIETAVVNSQLASSMSPEIRNLFDSWIKCMSGEIKRALDGGADSGASLLEISDATGLSRESVLSLLVALDRSGDITITRVSASTGEGKNRDICGCLRGNRA